MLNIEGMPMSVVQKSAHDSRSEKYSHLPTVEVVKWLEQEQFYPVKAYETKTRKPEKRGFQKHMIRFRHLAESALVGDSLPEIVVINSHDGTCALQLWAGVFRIVCENGMIVASETYNRYSISHRGDVRQRVIDASHHVIIDAKRALLGVQEWSKIDMGLSDQTDFAASALVARFGDLENSPVKPSQLLFARRSQDWGSDLWSVFNRVQENLIRGGLVGMNRVNDNGQPIVRTLRPIRGAARNVELNTDLWRLADNYALSA